MSWKDLPYWLKGGIIGLIAGFILSRITFVPYIGSVIYKIIFIPIVIFNIGNSRGLIVSWQTIFLPITFLYQFTVGVLIGFIYGKIKQRNQPNL